MVTFAPGKRRTRTVGYVGLRIGVLGGLIGLGILAGCSLDFSEGALAAREDGGDGVETGGGSPLVDADTREPGSDRADAGDAGHPRDAGDSGDPTDPTDPTDAGDDAGASTDAGDAGASTDAGDAGTDAGLDAGPPGGTGPHPGNYKAGTRLRPNVLTGDAVKLFESWHDTQLTTDCSFTYAEDGALRCVPSAPEARYFTDSGCTTPVFVHSSKYLLVTGSTCGTKVYASDQSDAVGGRGGFTIDGYGMCVSTSLPSGATGSKKIAASGLVGATVTKHPRADGLGVLQITATDGAEETTQVVDLARDAACAPGRAPAIAGRCVPSELAQSELLASNSTCSNQLARADRWLVECGVLPSAIEVTAKLTGGSASKMTNEARLPACDPPEYRERGARHAGALYTSSGSSCVVLPPSTEHTLPARFTMGAVIAPASLPPILTGVEAAGARLGRRTLVTATANERLLPTSFFDVARGVPCAAGRDPGGTLRCVPEATAISPHYSDAACQIPILVTGASSCAHLPKVVSFAEAGTTRFASVGGAITPPTIYERGPSGCVVSGDSVGSRYTLTPLHWGDLVPLTRTTE